MLRPFALNLSPVVSTALVLYVDMLWTPFHALRHCRIPVYPHSQAPSFSWSFSSSLLLLFHRFAPYSITMPILNVRLPTAVRPCFRSFTMLLSVDTSAKSDRFLTVIIGLLGAPASVGELQDTSFGPSAKRLHASFFEWSVYQQF
ncbi:hypothetical protein C8Q74DRAFT_247975 [Fomes fomentarius]|nr:hypothetical protein C8Q74DRAFT_247975 [Fomes fomentarius]